MGVVGVVGVADGLGADGLVGRDVAELVVSAVGVLAGGWARVPTRIAPLGPPTA